MPQSCRVQTGQPGVWLSFFGAVEALYEIGSGRSLVKSDDVLAGSFGMQRNLGWLLCVPSVLLLLLTFVLHVTQEGERRRVMLLCQLFRFPVRLCV